MHVNGSGTCHGDGCNRRPVSGMSFCSEEHYEELVSERKAKNGYRTASPALVNDYSAQLQPAHNQGLGKKAGRPPKPAVAHDPKPPTKISLSYAKVSDDRLREMRLNLGMSYKQIDTAVGVDWTVIAIRCEKIGLGKDKVTAQTAGNSHVEQPAIDLPPSIAPQVDDVKFEVGTGVDIKNAMWHVVEHLRAQRSRLAEEMLDIDTTISLLEKRIAP